MLSTVIFIQNDHTRKITFNLPISNKGDVLIGLGQLTVELILGFFGLLLVTRFLGKTQITQLTAFDFISALIMGELLGTAIYDDDTGVVKVIFAITVWGLLIFAIQLVGQKSMPLRNLLEGKPSLVIQKGGKVRPVTHRKTAL